MLLPDGITAFRSMCVHETSAFGQDEGVYQAECICKMADGAVPSGRGLPDRAAELQFGVSDLQGRCTGLCEHLGCSATAYNQLFTFNLNSLRATTLRIFHKFCSCPFRPSLPACGLCSCPTSLAGQL